MHLSKRGEYGLRAMIRLTDFYLQAGDSALKIKAISNQEGIPIKFLQNILLTLKNAGFLQSRMGLDGGYYLAHPPDEITLGAIIRVLDGPLAPVRCVSQMAYEPCNCPNENTCGLKMVMGDVRNAIAQILDHTSLVDVVRRVK